MKDICVLLPAHNEETTIGETISQFRKLLPEATIVVGVNCCTDRTEEIAVAADALCIKENRAGKGRIVKKLFECSPSAELYIYAMPITLMA